MNTLHPAYPLEAEENDAIAKAMNQPGFTWHKMLELQAQFDQRRDAEFPGWIPKYNEAMAAWFKHIKSC